MNYTGNYTHEIHRGDIFMVDLGDVEGRNNSLFAKVRPCCCISNKYCNLYSADDFCRFQLNSVARYQISINEAFRF